MPVSKKYLAPFEHDCIYHVYNRTNNHELLFRTERNYSFFLSQFANYLSSYADVYAWNLLPDHFHFLIRVKCQTVIFNYLSLVPICELSKTERQYLIDKDIDKLIERAFTRLFATYAMAFNNMFNRKGNLFYRSFKRVEINSDEHFTQALIYIHANAQKHNLVNHFLEHRWTSYHVLVSKRQTALLRKEIYDWFGGKEKFIYAQQNQCEYYYNLRAIDSNILD